MVEVPSEEAVRWKEGIGGRLPAVRGGACCWEDKDMSWISVAVVGRSSVVSMDSGCAEELRLCEENFEERFLAEIDSLLPLDVGAGCTRGAARRGGDVSCRFEDSSELSLGEFASPVAGCATPDSVLECCRNKPGPESLGCERCERKDKDLLTAGAEVPELEEVPWTLLSCR